MTDARTALVGTGVLIRFILRRDRVRIPLWIVIISGFVIWTAAVLPDFYLTEADRQSRAELMSNPAARALAGPGHGLDNYTFGAMMTNEMMAFAGIAVAVMSVLLVVRHTREEEETGRAELVRSCVVGRHAHLAAALTVAILANVVLGVVHTVGLVALGIESIDLVGSIAFAAALATIGLVFAAIAAVTAQEREFARGANGMAFAALGVAYALRAAGDMTDGPLSILSWFSPFGWAHATRAYVDERWWPLGLAVVVAAALVAAAFRLSTMRDVGAGLRTPGHGAATASDVLVHPIGLALRLHRGSILAWGAGLFAFGLVYGSLASEIEAFVADNPVLKDFLEQVEGVDIIDSWMGIVVMFLSIFCGMYALLTTLRLRTEETAGRAEPLLATSLSRERWMASHVVVALAGGIVMLLLSALGLGISAALVTEDAGLLTRLLGASLVYIPPVWFTAGVAAALFGIAPRFTAAAWVILAYAITVGMLGDFLKLPEWMADISPFGIVPRVPAEDLTLWPVLALSLVTIALLALGFAGFRRRDLESV